MMKMLMDEWIKQCKYARYHPSIFYLLFADNSFFFYKTNKEECQTILEILKEYETVSGQKIKESSIQFCHKIEEPIRHELHDILGIQNIFGM